jgi:inhibitor of KinA
MRESDWSSDVCSSDLIAESQTGMYPVASPGGWQIIGRTPLRLFAPERKSPFLYEAGDRIRFVPIPETEFVRLQEEEVG